MIVKYQRVTNLVKEPEIKMYLMILKILLLVLK